MPIYEYRCSKCGKTYEVMQKFSDAPVTVHENCGGEVEKLISASGFQLKGSGWYATDYAKSSAKSKGDGNSETKADSGEKKSDSKPESSETKSSETKTESKPADTTSKKSD